MRVFLGGSCNPTTWRKDVAIPILEAAAVSYYNPQVDDWSPELVDIEAKAKEEAETLLFVIDSQTRAVASILEATEMIMSGRDVVLVIDHIADGTEIGGQQVTGRQLQDLNCARTYLSDLAKRHSADVYKTVAEAVTSIC